MKRFGDLLVLQLDPMQIIMIVGAIVAIPCSIILIYEGYEKLVCRLDVEFDDANCTHGLEDSLGMWTPGMKTEINSTQFRIKFTVKNISKKRTTIHGFKHEVKISGKWHPTETPDLQHTVTIESGDSKRFDQNAMVRSKLLEANHLPCRIMLLHTHRPKKQKYVSKKTR